MLRRGCVWKYDRCAKVSPPGDVIGDKRGEQRARSDVESWPVVGGHWSGSMATVPVRKEKKEISLVSRISTAPTMIHTADHSGNDEAYSDEV
jgi:hypothetical protein